MGRIKIMMFINIQHIDLLLYQEVIMQLTCISNIVDFIYFLLKGLA